VPYPEWATHLLPFAEAAVTAAGAAGARLVVIDNLYMYGPPVGPMTETTPRAAQGRKGRLRARLENYFLEAHRAGVVRVAIGRASDFYGPAANSAPNMLVMKPALEGKSAAWLASLDAPHTLSYLPDVARGLVTLGERDAAAGEVWHLPAAEPLTGRQFIEMVFAELGRSSRMRVISRTMMRLAGLFSALTRESAEVFYQFERPFIMDSSKFEHAFGKQVTSHRDAIREIVRLAR
jgi:nucleoside-diphosphate-sugar epimerase